jgi:hypothetical protein
MCGNLPDERKGHKQTNEAQRKQRVGFLLFALAQFGVNADVP